MPSHDPLDAQYQCSSCHHWLSGRDYIWGFSSRDDSYWHRLSPRCTTCRSLASYGPLSDLTCKPESEGQV